MTLKTRIEHKIVKGQKSEEGRKKTKVFAGYRTKGEYETFSVNQIVKGSKRPPVVE